MQDPVSAAARLVCGLGLLAATVVACEAEDRSPVRERHGGLVIASDARGFTLDTGTERIEVRLSPDTDLGWWIGRIDQLDLERDRLHVSLLTRVDYETRTAAWQQGLRVKADPIGRWADLMSPALRASLTGLDVEALDVGAFSTLHTVHPLPDPLFARLEVADPASISDTIGARRSVFFGVETAKTLEPAAPNEVECVVEPIAGRKQRRFACEIDGQRHVVRESHGFSGIVLGVATAEDVVAKFTMAEVEGIRRDGLLVADRVLLRHARPPVEGSGGLPRYLLLGDSIAADYSAEVRRLLEGRVSVHQPFGNCRGTEYSTNRIDAWLGRWQLPDEGWDVISFNFGQWDINLTREAYQEKLVGIIEKLRRTGAKLLWVTTTPIPGGYEETAPATEGAAPGRTHGAIARHLGPWAREVLSRYPEIEIVDAFDLVGTDPYYADWRALSTDLHLPGDPSRPLGDLVGRRVLAALGASGAAPIPLDTATLQPWTPRDAPRAED